MNVSLSEINLLAVHDSIYVGNVTFSWNGWSGVHYLAVSVIYCMSRGWSTIARLLPDLAKVLWPGNDAVKRFFFLSFNYNILYINEFVFFKKCEIDCKIFVNVSNQLYLSH